MTGDEEPEVPDILCPGCREYNFGCWSLWGASDEELIALYAMVVMEKARRITIPIADQ